MLKLLSATPSPYARKVRISLHEKNIPFELITEVPWNSTTQTPQYNPLEKLPVLIIPAEGISSLGLAPSADGRPVAIYESHFIMAWLDAKLGAPRFARMLPDDVDDVDAVLEAQEVEVVCDGICDAFVLRFFEVQRAQPSEEWIARQQRKIDGGVAWLAEKAEKSEKRGGVGGGGEGLFLIGDRFGLADVAAGTVCQYLDVRWPAYGWRGEHPGLARYVDGIVGRESFRATVPVPQVIGDKIV